MSNVKGLWNSASPHKYQIMTIIDSSQMEIIPFVNAEISIGISTPTGIMKMTAKRYFSRTIITIMTIITNAIYISELKTIPYYSHK